MDKTVIVSWTVPPALTGSAVIVENLARQFSKSELVLAGEKPSLVTILRWGPDKPEIKYIASPLPRGLRGEKAWRRLQVPLMLARTVRLVRREACRNVIGVFPDETYLFVAYLTARLCRTRFYAYFHNTYLENRRGALRRFAAWLQPRVFRSAKHVFVMSDGMRDLYERRYRGLACSALPHSFNEPLLETPPPPTSNKRWVVAFAGNLNESCADAGRRLFRAVQSLANIDLRIFSGLKALHFLQQGISVKPDQVRAVPRQEIVGELRKCDALLLPHGFDGKMAPEEYETIFPTKTIEYLISGRPILAHSPPGVFLTRFLKQHDCALVVEESSETALVDAIRRLQADAELRVRLVKNALRTARMFQAPVVAKHLREVLAQGETRDQRP